MPPSSRPAAVLNKKTPDRGFELMRHLRFATEKMTAADRFYFNRTAEFLNQSQERSFNGSDRLKGLIWRVILGALGAGFYFAPIFFYYIPIALIYSLTLSCPFYKLVVPAPFYVRVLRFLCSCCGICGAIFISTAASTCITTIHKDSMDNEIYREHDQGSGLLPAAFGCVFFIIALPIIMMLDGLCNFLRNHLIQR